ncbi:MAG: hypothetical protein DME18_12705 [Verrucomicrobia bacterium]|nr:MAG: hypothetical protein DME18_12705 [Verrucomicrobiota bacterium]
MRVVVWLDASVVSLTLLYNGALELVTPLTRPSGTLSPIGGEGWGEGVRFIGAMNRCASQRRSPDRGSTTRSSSWEVSFRFCARIGTKNQIGTPLPALSPQGGERVAEGRERGGSWEGDTSKIRT